MVDKASEGLAPGLPPAAVFSSTNYCLSLCLSSVQSAHPCCLCPQLLDGFSCVFQLLIKVISSAAWSLAVLRCCLPQLLISFCSQTVKTRDLLIPVSPATTTRQGPRCRCYKFTNECLRGDQNSTGSTGGWMLRSSARPRRLSWGWACPLQPPCFQPWRSRKPPLSSNLAFL